MSIEENDVLFYLQCGRWLTVGDIFQALRRDGRCHIGQGWLGIILNDLIERGIVITMEVGQNTLYTAK